MTVHREEGRFSIRVELTADFDDDYEGDDDGLRWLDAWLVDVKPRLVRAVFESLRADARFDVVPTARGASPEETLEIAVRWRPRARGVH